MIFVENIVITNDGFALVQCRIFRRYAAGRPVNGECTNEIAEHEAGAICSQRYRDA